MNKTINSNSGPRDVFLHLAVIIFLYVIIISLGALIFKYINIFFPDPLSGQFAFSERRALRWPLSVLVIVFPLYVWLSGFIQRDLLKHPAKHELKTRKWSLHFTLFVSAMVIVVDLVTLIFRFLGGELTSRFVLKVLVVLLLALAVFVYYGWNLRKKTPASKHPRMRLFVWGTVALTTLAILAGFFIVGSPREERLRQFDERRLSDLQSLQSEIIEYWRVKGTLPESLDLLKDDIRGFTPPLDPETRQAYGYRIIDELSFELCAEFNRSNKDELDKNKRPPAPALKFSYVFTPESWQHDAGRACFERTIDPDRFQPLGAEKLPR